MGAKTPNLQTRSPYNNNPCDHYCDVIMGAIASQITSLTIVYSAVYSEADQRKHQSSASPAFVRGIHRGPVNSSHKWPVPRKMFPFDDVIMNYNGTTPPTRQAIEFIILFFFFLNAKEVTNPLYACCCCVCLVNASRSVAANGCAAFKWKRCCHWQKIEDWWDLAQLCLCDMLNIFCMYKLCISYIIPAY